MARIATPRPEGAAEASPAGAAEIIGEYHAWSAFDLETELALLEAGWEVPGDRDAGGRSVLTRLDDDPF